MSDKGSKFNSDEFKRLCQNLNVEQTVSQPYHHELMDSWEHGPNSWSILSRCINTKLDVHMTLLQIRSTPLGPGLLSPTMLVI